MPVLWTVGAVLGVGLVAAVGATVAVWLQLRNLADQPPPPPMPCPACGGTDHDFRSGGLWDGLTDPATGRRPCGTFAYGVCRRCGARWGQLDRLPPYVASADEWHREVEADEQRVAEQLRAWTAHRRNDS